MISENVLISVVVAFSYVFLGAVFTALMQIFSAEKVKEEESYKLLFAICIWPGLFLYFLFVNAGKHFHSFCARFYN